MKMNILCVILFLFSLNIRANSLNFTYYIIDSSGAPLQINPEISNTNKGLLSDLLFEIYKERNDVNINPMVLPFNRMIHYMKNETHKHWINYGSPVWGGVQSGVLTKEKVFTVKHQFLSVTKVKIEKEQDLYGKNIVIIRGFNYPGLEALEKKRLVTFVKVPDHKAAILAIKKKRAEVFPDMGLRVKYMAAKYGLKKEEYYLSDAHYLIPDYDIHLSFSKAFPSKELDFIDSKMAALHKNGFIKSLIHKYNNFAPEFRSLAMENTSPEMLYLYVFPKG